MTNKRLEAYDRLRGVDLDHVAPAELERLYALALTLLPSSAPIYTATDKIPLRARIEGTLRVFEINQWRLDAKYRPRLRALREAFRGRDRCFVIGNGPSLNAMDLSPLKDEVTFAVNGFFLKMPALDWCPTFYLVEDHLVAEDRAPWIHALEGPTKLFPSYLGYCLDEAPDTIFFNHRPRVSYPNGFDFSTDAAEITYTGCTVTFTALQLAHYLGFRTIHLIGVDASYAMPEDAAEQNAYGVGVIDMASDDPNHFHPDYFGKGFRWHDPQVDKMLDAYAEAEKVTAPSGRRIVNSGVGGQLEVFSRRPFESLFSKSPAGKSLFSRSLYSRTRMLKPLLGQDEAVPPAGMIRPAALGDHCREKLAREGRAGRSVGPGWGGAAEAGFPRVLLVDFTAIGDGSATGEVKATLLGGWPNSELMQVFTADQSMILRQGGRYDVRAATGAPTDALVQIILAFAPDVILYRPTPDRLRLHQLLLAVLAERPIPVLIWIMDNWMGQLRSEQPDQFELYDEDMRALFDLAPFGLAISSQMAADLEARYGLPFLPIANGVDLDLFAALRAKAPAPVEDRLVVRYAGGLSERMGLDTLVALARAVETLSSEFDVRLEISTRDYWHMKAAHRFAGLVATTVMARELSREDYFAWLCGGDVVAICYNFDDESRTYVRDSLANKLPEGLASGAVALAIGPDDFATMKALRATGAGVAIGTADEETIAAHLERLLDIRTRAAITADQLTAAAAFYDCLAQREALRMALRSASRSTVDGAMTRDLVRRSRLSPWMAEAPARTAATEPAL